MALEAFINESGTWRSLLNDTTQTINDASILIGARVAPSSITAPPYNTVAGVEAKIGPLQIGRVFHNAGLPTSYTTTLADSGMNGIDSDAGCIISTQATGNYSAYVSSIPSTLLDEGKIYMTWHHEPEGDYGSPSDYITEYTAFYNAIKAVDSRVKIGPVAEGDKYGRYADSNAVAGSYLPSASICDFYGLDLYHPMNNRATPPTNDPETVITLPSFIDWQVWYGLTGSRNKPIIIPEWGMYAEPDQYNTGAPNTTDESIKQANRATMIGTWVEYMRTLTTTPVEAICYWYVDGKSTENGTFRPSDTASNQALANLTRAV